MRDAIFRLLTMAGFAFVVGAGVGVVHAPSARAAEPPARASSRTAGHAAPSRSRERTPAKPAAPHTFSCAEALEDGTLVDEHDAARLAQLAVEAHWPSGSAAPPVGKPLRVRLFCGPDLDGDGDREAVAEVSYPPASDGDATPVDGSPELYWLLVSRHGTDWRPRAGVSVDVDAPVEAGRSVTFVKRPGGKWAVEAQRQGGPAQEGCRLVAYEVFELQPGGLRSVEVGDRSTACVPCGCDG